MTSQRSPLLRRRHPPKRLCVHDCVDFVACQSPTAHRPLQACSDGANIGTGAVEYPSQLGLGTILRRPRGGTERLVGFPIYSKSLSGPWMTMEMLRARQTAAGRF